MECYEYLFETDESRLFSDYRQNVETSKKKSQT